MQRIAVANRNATFLREFKKVTKEVDPIKEPEESTQAEPVEEHVEDDVVVEPAEEDVTDDTCYIQTDESIKAEAEAYIEVEQRVSAQTKAKEDAEAQARKEQEVKDGAEVEAYTEASAKAKAEADAIAKEEARVKAEAEAKAKAEAQAEAKAKEEARLKAIAEAKAKADAIPIPIQVFILAAGDNSRWNGQIKHLQNINGEPLLKRTLRQLEGYKVTVITHRKAIVDVSPICFEIKDREPGHIYKLLADMLLTKELWHKSERTVFLLGDVVFTDEALALCMASDKSIEFFQSIDETFAITFTNTMYRRVELAIEYILMMGMEATTWELYRFITGIPLDRHWIDKWYHHRISDRTDDIDYPNDYYKKIKSNYYEGM